MLGGKTGAEDPRNAARASEKDEAISQSEDRGPPRSQPPRVQSAVPLADVSGNAPDVPVPLVNKGKEVLVEDQVAGSSTQRQDMPRVRQPDAAGPLTVVSMATGSYNTPDTDRELQADPVKAADVPVAFEDMPVLDGPNETAEDANFQDPDEMMLSDEEFFDDADEVNEDQQRLRDVMGRDSGDGLEDGECLDDPVADPADSAGVTPSAAATNIVSALEIVGGWQWTMTVEQRWETVVEILSWAGISIEQLRRLSEAHVEDARRDVAAASALAFKQATVIGATVVGAARRLDALRAAEPFAMVVEEACEVMEPSLMSVLAVRSLRKLELIGDHFQLPAFVQNCWFNIESTHPSIKVSLFERLIKRRAPATGGEDTTAVSCTVLDEQRRMRPAICDLTRGEYAGIVEIIDHPITSSRLLGDAALKSSALGRDAQLQLRSRRQLWDGGGAVVPGVQPQEYFWNLSGNAEGRPVAGLSACNPVEAEAVARLVLWHVTCGVPPQAISVITPYKGQKSAIIKALQNVDTLHQGASSSRGGANAGAGQSRGTHVAAGGGGRGQQGGGRGQQGIGRGRHGGRDTGGRGHGNGRGGGANAQGNSLAWSIEISTVDRYQGDENDIVILSLVRTRPGNRFVALSNRFIVAASRARLAFYVIGSTGAVTSESGSSGPGHWRRFLDGLSTPSEVLQLPDAEGPGGNMQQLLHLQANWQGYYKLVLRPVVRAAINLVCVLLLLQAARVTTIQKNS